MVVFLLVRWSCSCWLDGRVLGGQSSVSCG